MSCSSSSPTRRYRTIDQAHNIQWRYVTQDNQYVLVLDPDVPGGNTAAQWVFVRRGTLPSNLCPYSVAATDPQTSDPIIKCTFTNPNP